MLGSLGGDVGLLRGRLRGKEGDMYKNGGRVMKENGGGEEIKKEI